MIENYSSLISSIKRQIRFFSDRSFCGRLFQILQGYDEGYCEKARQRWLDIMREAVQTKVCYDKAESSIQELLRKYDCETNVELIMKLLQIMSLLTEDLQPDKRGNGDLQPDKKVFNGKFRIRKVIVYPDIPSTGILVKDGL